MSQSIICDHKTLFALTKEQACNMAKADVCREAMKKINFYEFYFCQLQQEWWWFILLSIIMVYIIFRFISISIDEYVAPAITRLSNVLGLSDGLAAVTLIALANGAGDVITAIVSSDGEGGVSYNIGALYGAGLFCTSLVIAITLISSPTSITLPPNVLYRDIVFYILATLFTIVIAIIGKITVLMTVLMLVLYLALVVTVIIQDKLDAKNSSNEDKLISNNNQEQEIDMTKIDQKEKQDQEQPEEPKKKNPFNKLKSAAYKIKMVNTIAKLVVLTRQQKKSLVKKLEQDNKEQKEEQEEEEQKSTTKKVLDILDLPLDYLRKVTILPAEEEHFHHYWTYLWCVFGVAFLLVFTVGFKLLSLYILIPLALAFFLLFYFMQRNLPTKSTIPKCFTLMNVLSIFSGCFWAFIVIEVLVDLMTCIGLIAQLSNTFLGLTVLAIGNALPDALTTIALAKKGQAITGIIGTYAGQLFGLLIGFGVAQLKTTIKSGSQVFDLFTNPKPNMLDIIVIMFSLFTLVFSLVYGILNNKVFDKRLGYILVTVYSLFFFSAVVVQIVQLADPKKK